MNMKGYVYFLIEDSKVVYIGGTRRLDQRIYEHLVLNKEKKQFQFVCFEEVPIDELRIIERKMIKKYIPQYNKATSNITERYSYYKLVQKNCRFNNLDLLLQDREMSAHRLSEIAGVSVSSIRSWRKNIYQPLNKHISKLNKALNLPEKSDILFDPTQKDNLIAKIAARKHTEFHTCRMKASKFKDFLNRSGYIKSRLITISGYSGKSFYRYLNGKFKMPEDFKKRISDHVGKPIEEIF